MKEDTKAQLRLAFERNVASAVSQPTSAASACNDCKELRREVQELKTIVQSLFEYKKKPDTENILQSLGLSSESRKRSIQQTFHPECPPPIAPVQNQISSSLLQFPWSLLQGTIPCASPNHISLAMLDSLSLDATSASNIPGARWNSPTLLESVRKIESNSINPGDNSMIDSLSYDGTDMTSSSTNNTHQMLLMMNRNNIQNQNILNSMSVSQAANDLAKVGTSGSLQQLVQQIQQQQVVAAAAAAVTAATQSQTSPTSQVQTATQHFSSIAPVVTAALTNPSLFFPLSVTSNGGNHHIHNNGRLLTSTPHQNTSCGSNSSSSISSISSNNTTPIVPEKKKQVSDDFVKIIRQNDLSEDRISKIEIPVREALKVDPAFRSSSEQQIIQIVLKNKRVEELDISEVMTQLCKKLAEKRVFGSKLMAQTTVAGPNHSTYNNLPIEGIIYIQHVCRKVLGRKVSSEDQFWDVFRDAMRKLAARCRRVRHARKTKSVLENSLSIKKEASSDSSGDSVSDNHLNSSGDSSSALLLPTLTQIC